VVDNHLASTAAACVAPLGFGWCATHGTLSCEDGALVCHERPTPDSSWGGERCDWEDRDCNGVPGILDAPNFVDSDGDGYPGVDRCHAEVPLDCNDGDPLLTVASVEVCNGRDDDCDGATDEDIPDGPPGSCFAIGERGRCAIMAHTECRDGATVCVPATAAAEDDCTKRPPQNK
jgi:hypothetical protein